MSIYSIQYAPDAAHARKSMGGELRTRFDAAMRQLAADPYGGGSTSIGDDPDRREATVADAVIRYYVSRPVTTVTVVRIVYI